MLLIYYFCLLLASIRLSGFLQETRVNLLDSLSVRCYEDIQNCITHVLFHRAAPQSIIAARPCLSSLLSMESFPLTLITSPQSRAVANFMRVSSICPSQLSDKEDGCQSRSLNTLVTETQKNGNQETTTSVPSHPIGVANSWSLIQTVKS